MRSSNIHADLHKREEKEWERERERDPDWRTNS